MKARTRGRSFGRGALAASLLTVPLAGSARAVECGDVIGPNESVILDHDLECGGPGNALTVIGPAAVELGGHFVECLAFPFEQQKGIVVTGRGARIHGGIVQDCAVGLLLAGEGRHRIRAGLAEYGQVGVLVESDRNWVEGTHAVENDDAGFRIAGSRNRFRLARAYASPTGFEITGGRNQLRDTSAAQNTFGYSLSGGERNSLRDSRASKNVRHGFLVAQGDGHSLVNNRSLENEGSGFYVSSLGKGIRLQGNQAEDNAWAGIQVWTDGHKITRNTSLNNDAAQIGFADVEDHVPGCGKNKWRKNVFVTSDAACIE